MAINKIISPGSSATIPYGYHSEDIQISTPTLASQTPGTATAANILKGKTAWVNGQKITGTNTGVDGQILLVGPSLIVDGSTRIEVFKISNRVGPYVPADPTTISSSVVCNVNTNRLLIVIGTLITGSLSDGWDEMQVIDTAWASSLGPYYFRKYLNVMGSGSSAIKVTYGATVKINSSKGGNFSAIIGSYMNGYSYSNDTAITTIQPIVEIVQFKQ